MRNMRPTDDFLNRGGSELAPCSTTPDLEIAVRYAKNWEADDGQGEQALIFRLLCENFMQRGPDLKFLSAFPHEQEALYPPLTFFKPIAGAEPEHLTYGGTEFTIVDVRPNFPF